MKRNYISSPPEEAVEPYMPGHFVAGDCRGSHVMPIMPVAAQAELAYTGIVDTLDTLDKEFFLR